MSRRHIELATSAAMALTLIPLAISVHRASQRASTSELAAVWVCSVLLLAAFARSRARYPRVLATFGMALGLSTLATGAAFTVVFALMLLSVLSGFATLLDVPAPALKRPEPLAATGEQVAGRDGRELACDTRK